MTLRRSLTSLAAAIALTACGAKDVPKPAADAAKPAAAANVVSVHASDFAFDAPAEIPSGMTTFKLMNMGQTLHHMIIVRIDSGKTFADVQAAFAKMGPPPAWVTFVGGPNAPDPQAESNATLDIQPGSYAILCMVDLPGGVPHFSKGMLKPLTVTPSTTAAAPAPVSDVQITLSDYNFKLSKPLTAGPHTFEVVTAPGQPHELELIRLAPGKTFDDLKKWMGEATAGKAKGPPPANAIGGVTPTTPGVPLYFTADLTPGDYLLLCFMPDAKDMKAHFEHGMMQAFKIS